MVKSKGGGSEHMLISQNPGESTFKYKYKIRPPMGRTLEAKPSYKI